MHGDPADCDAIEAGSAWDGGVWTCFDVVPGQPSPNDPDGLVLEPRDFGAAFAGSLVLAGFDGVDGIPSDDDFLAIVGPGETLYAIRIQPGTSNVTEFAVISNFLGFTPPGQIVYGAIPQGETATTAPVGVPETVGGPVATDFAGYRLELDGIDGSVLSSDVIELDFDELIWVVQPPEVPSVRPWGAVLLGLLLCGAGILHARQRLGATAARA